MVTGWGSVHGFPVGVVANQQGVIFSEEAHKATEFIQLCNRYDTPIVFVHNATGYMVGKDYEQRGIIKDGAKMINAVANSSVPHIALMAGVSYGAGNYGMSGKSYNPRFIFGWPTHKVAVMGPRQLAGVMSIIGRQAAESQGRPFDEEADAAMRANIEQQIEHEELAYFSTARVRDDGLFDPRDTRTCSDGSPPHLRPGPWHRRIRCLPHVAAARLGTTTTLSQRDPHHQAGRGHRGEIARRVTRTAKEMGIATVAVFSDPDSNARFVAEADESVPLGGSAPADSYLRGDRIIAAAKLTGADASTRGTGSWPRAHPSPRR